MFITIEEPIEPGSRHLLTLPPLASTSFTSVDYLVGPASLLHIAARGPERMVVLNDRLVGTWREELRLPIPPESASRPLPASVLFKPFGVSVAVGSLPPLHFDRGGDFGDVDGIRLHDAIAFKAEAAPPPVRQPDVTILPEPLALPGPAQPAGCIEVADVQHAAGWIAAPALPPGAALCLLVNGREVAHAPLPPAKGASRLRFLFRFGDACLANDGQEAVLLFEAPGLARVLGRAMLDTKAEGGIDRAGLQGVRGWARNLRQPDRPVLVEVLLNGEPVGTAWAGRGHPGLRALGETRPDCGFAFRFKPSLNPPDGAELDLAVRIRGTGIELVHSPWPLVRPADPTRQRIPVRHIANRRGGSHQEHG